MTAALFVLAAAFAAALRLAIGVRLGSWWGLLVVNVAGSALLGVLVASDASTATVTVLGTGGCGALTTYSSFALEVRSLGPLRGAAYGSHARGRVHGGPRRDGLVTLAVEA